MKLISEEALDKFEEDLRKAREEDLADGWDPDAPEEGEGIDPTAENMVLFAKKKGNK